MDHALEVACAQRKLERQASQFARDFAPKPTVEPKPQPNRTKLWDGNGVNEVRARSEAEYIYIISHPEFDGWVKVGEAMDVKDRLKTFNCASPVDYTLVKQWKVGGAINDKTIHRALEKLGIERNREWFVMDEVEAVAYVGALVEDAVEHFVPESEELTSYEMNAILNPDKHLAEWIALNTCA